MTTPNNDEDAAVHGSSQPKTSPSRSSEREEGDDLAGDTYSIDSTAKAFRIEHGRRYQAYRDGAYWAPNDELQQEHLDISHRRFLSMLDDKLFLAPIPNNIETCLDLGTGTGIWAIDFADLYPDASVLGTDLSPIQPEMVPPNCRFEIDDMTEEWTYPESHFDFIHIRSLFGSISDWDKLYAQAFKHLKPGGFIEHTEPSLHIHCDDGTVAADNPLHTFADIGERTGQSMDLCPSMVSKMVAAGFVNPHDEVFKTPLGEWSNEPKLRDTGKWNLLQFDIGLEGFAVHNFTSVLDMSLPEVQILCANVRAAARDLSNHAYYEHHVVYAQKPPAA